MNLISVVAIAGLFLAFPRFSHGATLCEKTLSQRSVVQRVAVSSMANALRTAVEEGLELRALRPEVAPLPSRFKAYIDLNNGQTGILTARLRKTLEARNKKMRLQYALTLKRPDRYFVDLSYLTANGHTHGSLELTYDRAYTTSQERVAGEGPTRRTVRYSAVIDLEGEPGRLIALVHQEKIPMTRIWENRNIALRWQTGSP